MPANVVVPEVGESIVDARVAKWLKKEGDAVNVGEPLVELETDKIDLEVAAPQAGVLKSIAHGDGADVKVGEVLGVIEEGSTSAAAPAPATGEKAAKADAKPAEPAQPEATKQRATPAARNAAQQNAVDLKQIPGSGDAGRVMKRDVEATFAEATAPRAASAEATAPKAASAEATAPRAASAEATAPRPVMKPAPRPAVPVREERRIEGDRTEERVRMSKRRATIARRLVEAQSTAAMLTTFNEVDMTGIMAIRQRHKETFKERFGVNLGLTSFFVKAAIGALRRFPRINAEIQGDEMVLKHYYDIGVAVGAKEGLVVPVLRDADRMSFAQIEKKVRELAKAAEGGTLSLAALTGGTFTIT